MTDNNQKNADHSRNDASPVDTGVELTPAQKSMRRKRNLAIAIALGAFIAIIYAVTVAKLGVNVLKRPI